MERQTVVVNGLESHYLVGGSGPDVIFVHGWASSARMWGGVLATLSHQFRCWALDLPGCGQTEKPAPRWYSIPHFTAHVQEFARLMGITPLRLVGHSMGGMIVLDLAGRFPDSVARVAAINPVVTGRANLRPLAHPKVTRRLLNWTLRLSPRVWQPILASPLSSRVSGVHHIRRRTEEFSQGTADSLLFSGRAVVTYDLSPHLAEISAPAMIVIGDRDVNVPSGEARLADRRIPNCKLHVLRGGHMIADDRPRDVARLLGEFLA
ncbi:MAG: alpha/beta hydrolase [Anaerolineales bacterium]